VLNKSRAVPRVHPWATCGFARRLPRPLHFPALASTSSHHQVNINSNSIQTTTRTMEPGRGEREESERERERETKHATRVMEKKLSLSLSSLLSSARRRHQQQRGKGARVNFVFYTSEENLGRLSRRLNSRAAGNKGSFARSLFLLESGVLSPKTPKNWVIRLVSERTNERGQ
jgi:hypothetical protein